MTMKKAFVVLFIVLLVSLCANIFLFSNRPSGSVICKETVEKRDTLRDTIYVPTPVPVDSSFVKTVFVRLPVFNRVDTVNHNEVAEDSLQECEQTTAMLPTDSVDVEIPITQKVYDGEGYRAYVSGFNQNLDSLLLFKEVERVTIRSPTKSPRFSVGLQAGYGMTPKGFQPYFGVGISVNLWSR